MNLRQLNFEKLTDEQYIIKKIKNIIIECQNTNDIQHTLYNRINRSVRFYFVEEDRINHYSLSMPDHKLIVTLMLHGKRKKEEDKEITITLDW